MVQIESSVVVIEKQQLVVSVLLETRIKLLTQNFGSVCPVKQPFIVGYAENVVEIGLENLFSDIFTVCAINKYRHHGVFSTVGVVETDVVEIDDKRQQVVDVHKLSGTDWATLAYVSKIDLVKTFVFSILSKIQKPV